MDLLLHSTEVMTECRGTICRVWEGVTANGVPAVALIALVAARADHDQAEFQRDLAEHRPPSLNAMMALTALQVEQRHAADEERRNHPDRDAGAVREGKGQERVLREPERRKDQGSGEDPPE